MIDCRSPGKPNISVGSARLHCQGHESPQESLCPGKVATERIRQFQDSWGSGLSGAIPQYYESDFEYQRVLGKGSFSIAQQVTLLNPGRDSWSGHRTYALKRLKKSLHENKTWMSIAVSDLALETTILSNLQHKNIISLRGVKSGDMIESLSEGNFFILLDLLVDTLDARLERWAKQHNLSFFAGHRLDEGRIARRLKKIALGIAEGMEYLHSRNILFRDLKPSNIGFDSKDEVRIFDFGLAREHILDTNGRKNLAKPRLMTGGAGTPRYMAPEVARLDETYSFPADVYSFSILLWQLTTDRVPFGSITCPKEFALKVVVEDKRPSLKEIESKSLKDLLASGWATNPLARPNFSEVRASLEIIIADFSASRRKKLQKLFRRSVSTPVHSSCIDCAPTETHARMPSYRRYHTELYGDKRDVISRNLYEQDDSNTTARSFSSSESRSVAITCSTSRLTKALEKVEQDRKVISISTRSSTACSTSTEDEYPGSLSSMVKNYERHFARSLSLQIAEDRKHLREMAPRHGSGGDESDAGSC